MISYIINHKTTLQHMKENNHKNGEKIGEMNNPGYQWKKLEDKLGVILKEILQ